MKIKLLRKLRKRFYWEWNQYGVLQLYDKKHLIEVYTGDVDWNLNGNERAICKMMRILSLDINFVTLRRRIERRRVERRRNEIKKMITKHP